MNVPRFRNLIVIVLDESTSMFDLNDGDEAEMPQENVIAMVGGRGVLIFYLWIWLDQQITF